MNPLDRDLFYRGLHKVLCGSFGKAYGDQLWKEAGKYYRTLCTDDPSVTKHPGAMVLPAVSVYTVLQRHGEDASGILNAYGDAMGKKFASLVRVLTSVPGIPSFLWNHIESVMDTMSSEKKGYTRRIVSDPPDLYGVDILSCPYHELAKQTGCEKAVHCICRMDKAYMKGFRHIRYERTKAVSEGADCCDYRLSRLPD